MKTQAWLSNHLLGEEVGLGLLAVELMLDLLTFLRVAAAGLLADLGLMDNKRRGGSLRLRLQKAHRAPELSKAENEHKVRLP